jgi:hypothetical protein
MSVVAESPHVARSQPYGGGVDTRMRQAPAPVRLRPPPVAVVATYVGVVTGFRRVENRDTHFVLHAAEPNDTAQVQVAQDAQDRLLELLSQMRALEAEAADSPSGTEAGRSSVNSQMESLAAEASGVADLVQYADIHRQTTEAFDVVSVVRQDVDMRHDTPHARSYALRGDPLDTYAGVPNVRATRPRIVPLHGGSRSPQAEIPQDSTHHSQAVTQRLVEHIDTLGTAFVAPINYMPVGAALAAMYATAWHPTSWRDPKAQPESAVSPVQQTLATRYL